MKIHKQSVLIETEHGYLEVLSFYDTVSETFGADIYYDDRWKETVNAMTNEPLRDHLLALGYNYLLNNDHRKAG